MIWDNLVKVSTLFVYFLVKRIEIFFNKLYQQPKEIQEPELNGIIENIWYYEIQ